MNFVAHYFLDRNHASSLFTIGAATPDLLSIYNSGLRIKAGHVKKLKQEDLQAVDRGFVEGLRRHFFADGIFHSSDSFREETAEIGRCFERHMPGQKVPRRYFIAHILLELLLDKVLIRKHPRLLDAYYEEFRDHAPFREVRGYTERIAGHPLPNYENFLMKFLENRYLDHYREYGHIIYILRRLLRRVGIERSGFVDLPAFLTLMEEYEARLSGIYKVFFAEIRERERQGKRA